MPFSSAGNVGNGVLCSRVLGGAFGGVDGIVRFSAEVNATAIAVIFMVNIFLSRFNLRL